MIVKMKQLTLLVSNRGRDRAIEKLRTFGTIHIKRKKFLSSGEVSFLEDKISIFERAMRLIAGFNVEPDKDCPREKIPTFIEEIDFLNKDRESLESRLALIKKDLDWYRDWGIFSLDSLSYIKENGLNLKLSILNKRDFKRTQKDKVLYLLKRERAKFYVALISDSEGMSWGSSVDLPKREYSKLVEDGQEIQKELKEIGSRMQYLSRFKNCFSQYKYVLDKKLEFAEVNSELDISEGFSSIEGFIPIDTVESLNILSDKEGWGVFLRDPEDPEEVPTLIRNPRWLRIVDPIFKLMDTIPGYEEYDISLWFLIFFSIFFAMIIGDAGYGLVFLSVAFLIRFKNKTFSKQILYLIYSLSFSTIAWGAITGNWFGVERLSQAPLLNIFVIDSLNSFVDSNQNNFIYLCFILGITHLTIAHLVAAARFINSLKAISHLGWIIIGWSMFLLTRGLVLNLDIPKAMPLFVVFGALMVMLFSKPKSSILKKITAALLDIPFAIINFFADILSYLRLFAVGYATVMIAITFNNMAGDIGFNSITTILVSTIIILLGHSLNIVLGLMSVLVHGVRLNVLEFSTHLDLEWKGRSYKPFKG